MKFDILESGSKGNCTIISNNTTKIAIDCGGTKKYILNSLKEIKVDISEIDALLITHTHSDHIKQIKIFDEIKTYALGEIDCKNLVVFNKDEDLNIGDFWVKPLPTSHDCDFSCGFIIYDDYEKLVYITDTGYVNEKILNEIMNANYYIIESNHDVEMLMGTNRPIHIKQRIISDQGHLRNEQCAEVLKQVVGECTKEVVLAHLSEEGNKEEKAIEINKEVLNENIKLKVAKQSQIVSGGSYDQNL